MRNYNITAKKQGGTLLFLRKIVRGAADDSYGIEVAKLAGLPESVVTKAKGYLKSLETEKPVSAPAAPAAPAEDQVTLMDVGGSEIARELAELDLNTLTPIEALNTLSQLQKKAKG